VQVVRRARLGLGICVVWRKDFYDEHGRIDGYFRLRTSRDQHDVRNADTGGRNLYSLLRGNLDRPALFVRLEPTCQESLKPRMLPLLEWSAASIHPDGLS
jgi:hypothetical protein